MKMFIFFSLFVVISIILLSEQTFSQTNQSVFIPNTGKWNSSVKYMSRLNGMNFWINKDGFTIDNFRKISSEKAQELIFKPHTSDNLQTESRTGHVVRMSFVNTKNNFKTIIPENPVAKINSFIGNNCKVWNSSSSYSKLRVENLYKGIDAIISIEENQPRYDFIINPGAKPETIKFRFNGQNKLNIAENGSKIELNTRLGNLSTGRLYAYQEIDGKHEQIECQFVNTSNSISFKIGNYNRKYKLIIDPKIYATYLGGSTDEEITSSIIDKDNNLIVTGWTNSIDFPVTTGAYDTTVISEKDVFVSKLQLTGNERKVLFSTYIGGTGDDIANTVGVDLNGNIYIAGETNSANYPTQSGVSSQINGKKDGFITKLSADGSKILYSTYLGGEGDDYILAMGVGESGAVYVTGGTASPTFPSSAVYNIDGNKGREEAFITKISQSGSTVVYSAIMTTAGLDRGTAIAVDESQATVIACGITDNSRFYTTPNSGSNRVWDRYFNGGWDGFIAKIGTSGAFCEFAGFFGGAKDEYINAVLLDKDGSFYIAGQTNSNISAANPTSEETDFPLSVGAIDSKFHGVWDCFISKFDKKCNSLIFSTYYGGNNDDSFLSLARNTGRNSIFATGYSASSDFPIVNDPSKPKFGGGKDIILCEFDPLGTEVMMSTVAGGALDDAGRSITIDSYSDIYISGYTLSKNFPANKGGIKDAITGTKDGFVYKYTFKELILSNPIKGDEFCAGSKFKIVWSANNFSETSPKFNIEYSLDSGATWQSLVKDVTGLEYEWKIPQNIQSGNNYMVRIFHQSGVMSVMNGTFSIVSPPSIKSVTASPENLNVCEGSSVKFSVNATGKDIKFAWRRNGVIIPNATDSVYNITSLIPENSGKYDVKVSGKCTPDTTSSSFTLSVIPGVNVSNIPDQTVKAGKEAVFTVDATGSILSYQWYWKNSKITGATDSIFKIANCTKSHEGFYKCVVTGTCGTDTTNEAFLTVDTVNFVIHSPVVSNRDNLHLDISAPVNNIIALRATAEIMCNAYLYLTDNSGRYVTDLYRGPIDKSQTEITFDFNGYAQGVYWIVAECGANKAVRKCSIIK